jgi:hypothetical protein
MTRVNVRKLIASAMEQHALKIANNCFNTNRGARYLTGDNLKVVCAEFSTLS